MRYSLSVDLSVFLNQYRSVGRDALFATRKTEFLGGGGFDGDILFVYAHHVSEGLLHQGDVCFQLRTLGADSSVDIAYAVALGGDELYGAAQEYLAVDILKFACGVGEVIAYVAQVSCTQEGIADGMDEYIGIGVAEETSVVFEADAA